MTSANLAASAARVDADETRPHLLAASAAAAGTLFGFGLALSSMIRPSVVISFLRLQDLGLMLVLGAAVVVTLVAYRFVPRVLERPLLGGTFCVHGATMSRDTILGAAIFGVGWGLTGVCPGPAIAGIGAGSYELLYAVAGMAIGALIQGLTRGRVPR